VKDFWAKTAPQLLALSAGLIETFFVEVLQDRDFDLVPDAADNCPDLYNPGQGAGDCASPLVDQLTDREKGYLSSTDLSELGTLNGVDLNARGLSALQGGQALKATAYFKLADYLFKGVSSAESDKAKFFRAMTRVAAIALDNASDGAPDGYNDFGDILDGFGYPAAGRDFLAATTITVPKLLPLDAPTPHELTAFAKLLLRPELLGALDDLSGIAQTFNVLWTEPRRGAVVESDYGDVLSYRAALLSALGTIDLQDCYDLAADLAKERNDTSNTLEKVLANNSNLLKLTDTEKLASARLYARNAAQAALAAITWMQSESDDPSNDLVSLRAASPEEIADARNYLAALVSSLDTGSPFVYQNKTPLLSADDSILMPQIFFAGVDIRSLLPGLAGNQPKGFFPDSSFSGILTQYKGQAPAAINTDSDLNGNADIFDTPPEDLGGWYYSYYGANILFWDKVKDATQYHIYYSLAPNVTKASPQLTTTGTYYYHYGVQRGTWYYYRVSAVTGIGESPLSEEAAVYVSP
jgi:hypothetical protein